MSQYRYNFPTEIHFGPGVRSKAIDNLKSRGLTRPLVVTDRGLAELPVLKDFVKLLKDGGLEPQVFSGIWGNPVKSQVTAGVAAYRAAKANSMIGFGGGAALDVAKAILLMIHHPGDLFDYEDDKPGALPVDQEIPHWVALPTTAGTGSEVGRSAVVSDDVTHIKKIIFSPRLLAKAVFADPELTVNLPANITAWTGMDALTHCVEAFLAKGHHPIADGIALEGIRLAAGALEKAVKEPTNLSARGDMLMSSMMGAIAFQKGLGITHSCAHALSTVSDLHHGLANAVMIDHALAYNTQAVPERFVRMAEAVGLSGAEKSPEGFLRWLGKLKHSIGIPAKLDGVKVSSEKLGQLVEVAIHDACHPSNPRACTRETFEQVFKAAF